MLLKSRRNTLDDGLVLAYRALKRYGIPYIVLSGAERGTAEFNDRKGFREEQPPVDQGKSSLQVYMKNYSASPKGQPYYWTDKESLGNVIIPYKAFAKSLNVTRLLCFTSTFHVTRVQRYLRCCVSAPRRSCDPGGL